MYEAKLASLGAELRDVLPGLAADFPPRTMRAIEPRSWSPESTFARRREPSSMQLAPKVPFR